MSKHNRERKQAKRLMRHIAKVRPPMVEADRMVPSKIPRRVTDALIANAHREMDEFIQIVDESFRRVSR